MEACIPHPLTSAPPLPLPNHQHHHLLKETDQTVESMANRVAMSLSLPLTPLFVPLTLTGV